MAAGDLTTLQKVKLALGIKTAEADPFLRQLITSSSAWIKSYLNRDVLTASYTRTFDGRGGKAIPLPQYPVTAVTSVVVDGATLAATQYVLQDDAVWRLDGAVFPKGAGRCVISWTAGYAAAPEEVDRACVELVMWRYKEIPNMKTSSKVIGGETINFQTTPMPSQVEQVLKQWRNVVPR